jgi:hypothetical protein
MINLFRNMINLFRDNIPLFQRDGFTSAHKESLKDKKLRKDKKED